MADPRPIAAAALLALLGAVAACSGTTTSGRGPIEPPAGPINRLAILRFERAEPASPEEAAAQPTDNPGPRLAAHAETAVTAQLYGVLANDSRWRLVADLEVEDAMRQLSPGGSLEALAKALGEETAADAVVTGRVSRFQERIGGEYGARYPAAVSLDLLLVETATGTVLWRGSFDRTQRDLSSNLFEAFAFWEGGPRWLTAAELARLGLERLVADMDLALQQ